MNELGVVVAALGGGVLREPITDHALNAGPVASNGEVCAAEVWATR